jgi:hypothetical protein
MPHDAPLPAEYWACHSGRGADGRKSDPAAYVIAIMPVNER